MIAGEPPLAAGELVKVAGAQNQAEAELVQQLLLEEGVPSVLRRTRGFDVPDFLAAGPRDVLVPASREQAARAVLPHTDREPLAPARRANDPPLRVLAGLLIAVALVALIAWLVTALLT